MGISRRDFVRQALASAALLGLSCSATEELRQALDRGLSTLPKVIWLNSACCSGCTVSLANLFSSSAPTDVADLLINTISVEFHSTLMGAAGSLAVSNLKQTAAGPFVLVVDGGIPTAHGGHACILWNDAGEEMTAMQAVLDLAPKAAAVLCVGTCASFGGMAAAAPNPTGVQSVSALTGLSTINIAGCPPHPDWMVVTIARLLAGLPLPLDRHGRPFEEVMATGNASVHSNCPLKNNGQAHDFGEHGRCMKQLGCKGPRTVGDCAVTQWNSGSSWCMNAGVPCLGCTDPGFPDRVSPFFNVPRFKA